MQKYVFLILLTGIFRSVAAQQAPTRPATFPVWHRVAVSQYNLAATALPARPVAAVSVATLAAIPTVRAAAAYTSLPAPHSPPAPTDSLPLAPQRNLTGALASPPYDLYQNLPEEFRKRTLPAPCVEPLPLQLLRGALGH